jgi:acrylyl-CoA reductase (NADPH)
MTRYGGAVAACGNAGGMDLPGSVAPFILRGVRLIGIDSVRQPIPAREAAWDRLAREIDRDKLTAMTQRIGFADIPGAAQDIVDGKVRGRLVVEMSGARAG